MTDQRKRIAIVGGNFAGLTAAIKLSQQHAVTVIDPSRHFEWAPGIHEILSSVKTPQGLRLDRAAIVKQAGHRFLRDRVTVLEPAQGRLATAGGHELAFDACIVAVGALWNTHHVPGVARHAMPFRSVADGLAIEQRLHTLMQQGKPLRIVIVGGGLSGIEALGEILRRHRNGVGLSIELVEAGARLLPGLPASLDADLRRICEPYPVSFRTSTTIASVSAKGVRLADGTRLRSELTLWTAGLAPPALLRESGLAPPPQVWADVRATLQSCHFDNVFAVGDAAQLPHAVGKQAYNAIDMGALAATNAVRFLAGRALKPFKPAPKPVLVAFGDPQSYLVAGRTVVASKALAGAKEGVYQVFMAQMAPGSVLAGRGRPTVAQLASAGPAAVDVPGRLQKAAGSQGRQAAVDGTWERPGVIVDTPSPAGAADLCAFSAGQPRSTVQRKPTPADGRPTHADWHQAVIGPCGLCWPERTLYELVRS